MLVTNESLSTEMSSVSGYSSGLSTTGTRSRGKSETHNHTDIYNRLFYFASLYTVMILRFRTNRSGQTAQTQITLLPKVWSWSILFVMSFCLHLLDAFLYGKTKLFKVYDNFSGIENETYDSFYSKLLRCKSPFFCYYYFMGFRRRLSHNMTKPTKWVCVQRRLRSAWASAQSDQSLRCLYKESLGP